MLEYERISVAIISARGRAGWWLEILAMGDWLTAALMTVAEILSKGKDLWLWGLWLGMIAAGIACYWGAKRIRTGGKGAVLFGWCVIAMHGIEVVHSFVSFAMHGGGLSEMIVLTPTAAIGAVVVVGAVSLARCEVFRR